MILKIYIFLIFIHNCRAHTHTYTIAYVVSTKEPKIVILIPHYIKAKVYFFIVVNIIRDEKGEQSKGKLACVIGFVFENVKVHRCGLLGCLFGSMSDTLKTSKS